MPSRIVALARGGGSPDPVRPPRVARYVKASAAMKARCEEP
ncbi:MAG TPA: hypothetical protein VGB42_08430 [Candidatus Thermoplasmatota archaeon]